MADLIAGLQAELYKFLADPVVWQPQTLPKRMSDLDSVSS